MGEDIEIWRSANFYVGQFGKQAAHEARTKADELIERGDMAGAQFWRQVIKAIKALQSKKRPPDEPLH